jgi:two-component system, probable response regulator PhcQ
MNKITILYVDDEPLALKYFARLISPMYPVITALSVPDGIKLLESHGDEVAVLLSDQRMPGIKGYELLTHAKAHYPHILRILTTAYSNREDTIAAINEGGVYRYIQKPWDLMTLREEMKLAVEESLRRRENDPLTPQT